MIEGLKKGQKVILTLLLFLKFLSVSYFSGFAQFILL